MKQDDLNKALCMAAWHGHDFCLEMLIEVGAEVNVVYQSFTPLETAVRMGFVRCMKLLIQTGAAVNMRGNLAGVDVNLPGYLTGADVNTSKVLRYTPLIESG